MRNHADEFERQFAERGDPWDLATSPYEQERYSRTMAALGTATFIRGLELGAARGELTARLAPRCETLIALEPAPTAARAAAARLGLRADVRQGSAPEDLPSGSFDLIVCSEVLYYFDPLELDGVLDALEARLDGLLVAVHWRGRGTHQLTGGEVHDVLRARPGLERVHADPQPGYELELYRPASPSSR